MLIKYIQADKSNKPGANGKVSKSAVMNLDSGGPVRTQRKVLRVCPAKRPPTAPLPRASVRHRQALRVPPDGHDDAAMDPCDNSNDSGLGLEHSSTDISVSPTSSSTSLDNAMDQDTRDSNDSQPCTKRSRLSVKCEQDEVEDSSNDNFRFSVPLRELKAGSTVSTPSFPKLPLSGAVRASSSDGSVILSIVNQPEQQHRARYQTEGSRGAVKDRSGQSFPSVKLIGYNKPATLQVFIGSDVDRVSPHMFYQACRVCGKNSTPCSEQKTDGTIVIELQFEPAKNMVVTCDCVGILKERNVDVEHRFPEETVSRSKKKSTRCRMVFRTSIEKSDGTWETLQVVSQSIACTQLPGVPEISKRSLNASPCSGGQELFLLGKNFLKDSRVIFQQPFPSASKSSFVWEEEVLPDKEYLQPTHLVCIVPPFHRQDLTDPVTVRVFVRSSGKCSEPQSFQYLPNQREPTSGGTNKLHQQMQLQQLKQNSVAGVPQSIVAEQSIPTSLTENRTVVPLILPALLAGQRQQEKLPPTTISMMAVPASEAPVKAKLAVPEVKLMSTEYHQLLMDLLRQYLSETSSVNAKLSSNPVEADPRILSKLLSQYVSENTGSPLPAQSGSSVEKFLSKIENGANMPENKLKMTNNNECYVSSTSLDYPESKQQLPAMNKVADTVLTQSHVTGATITTTQLKNGISSKSIDSQTSSNAIINTILPNAMQVSVKPKESNFSVNTTISLQEVSTSIENQHNTKVMVPSMIEQVLLTSTTHNSDSSEVQRNPASMLVTSQIHEPVIGILNNSTMIMQDVITATSTSFDSQVNDVQITSQLLNQAVPCISDSLVQPMVVPSALMDTETNILSNSNSSVGLLNSELVDSSGQFQQDNSTLSTSTDSTSLMSIPNIQNEISQAQTLLPSINQPELVSDAHIMNTQLGQLLTTDMTTEDHTVNSALTGDCGNSPLVRDVLLGSGVTSAPLLSSTSVLGLHHETQHKKAVGAEGMLPQELTHMSDKDLLSYINPGCFDQVIP